MKKIYGLAQENGFGSASSPRLPWLVKGAAGHYAPAGKSVIILI
jgi:hypothetical protein